MNTHYELKKLKIDIENLCEKVMASLDEIENGIKSKNYNIPNKKVRILENQILNILLNFENFLLLLTENEDFESIQRNLIYVKGLLSVLRCCIISNKKDFDDIGIILICDYIYDECEKIIDTIESYNVGW